MHFFYLNSIEVYAKTAIYTAPAILFIVSIIRMIELWLKNGDKRRKEIIKRIDDESMVLVDMAMPKSCHECCCYDVDYQRCVIASQGIPSRYHYDGSVRPEWCPIKEDVLWKLK